MALKFAAGSREFLRSLAPKPRQTIRAALRLLEADPRHGRLALKQLRKEGPDRFYRAKVGDYRIVYTPRPEHVYVWRIQHRSEGYDWLDRLDPWTSR